MVNEKDETPNFADFVTFFKKANLEMDKSHVAEVGESAERNSTFSIKRFKVRNPWNVS